MLNTKAARDNPDLLFILMSFSMVLVRFGVGIINISRGDKFFFHFFEKFLNGLAGPFVHVWFVLVAGFVLDYPFWRLPGRQNHSRQDGIPPLGDFAYLSI